MITAALLGNPNVGKTTLFNYLTGSNQYVGNWAGVTVDKKEGYLGDIKIVDLPGIYALDTYSNEEKVSKNFLLDGNVDVIINILDASNLDRNMYLTMELMEFKKPIVIVLNMIDVAMDKGRKINVDILSKKLNCTVIPVIASKEKGLDEVTKVLKEGNFLRGCIENDYHFDNEKQTYAFIEKVVHECTDVISKDVKDTSDKIDKFVLNRFLAYPIFLLILVFIFNFTFSWVGQPLSDLIQSFISNILTPFLKNALLSASPWFRSLLIDGILGGVGSVIVFFPVICALFLCISFLEDSGYMARAAFIMDRIMRKMGLSGKAFIPLFVGFGCSVPAIMSARTLESEKDRKMTALLVPFMSCNARLPIYALFASVFFIKNQTLVVASLYFLGILVAFIIGNIFKGTIFKKEEEPFLIELPEYKLPEFKYLMIHTFDKAKGFLKKAGTIIFSISVIVWFLSNFNFHGMTNIDSSFLSYVGKILSPIFAPLGFGSWKLCVPLLTGLMAKEVIVGTLGVIFGTNLKLALASQISWVTAYTFLVFVLLYPACISAMATMRKEYGRKMAAFSITYQLILAYVCALIVHTVLSLV